MAGADGRMWILQSHPGKCDVLVCVCVCCVKTSARMCAGYGFSVGFMICDFFPRGSLGNCHPAQNDTRDEHTMHIMRYIDAKGGSENVVSAFRECLDACCHIV